MIEQIANQLRDTCKHLNDPTGVARLRVLECHIADYFWDEIKARPQLVRVSEDTEQWVRAWHKINTGSELFRLNIKSEQAATPRYVFDQDFLNLEKHLFSMISTLITHFCEMRKSLLTLINGPMLYLKPGYATEAFLWADYSALQMEVTKF